MDLIFSIDKTIPAADFDASGNLLPAATLRIFQEAAELHGEQMGVGFDAMLAKNLLWVVAQTRYEILQMPHPDQQMKITTWPLAANRLGFERCYTLCDQQGNLMIKGTSSWVVIDTINRKLCLRPDLYPPGEYCTEKPFSDRARRIPDFEAEAPAAVIIPDQRHIDHNGHVNNTHYPTFAQQALGSCAKQLKFAQIDYFHEVLCNQPLNLYAQWSGNTAIVKGEDDSGLRMFGCQFIYE